MMDLGPFLPQVTGERELTTSERTLRARVLAVEAGRTILLDREAFCRAADARRISVVAIRL